MTALIDTCVIVDTLQNRIPFSNDSNIIMFNCANNLIEGFVSAKSICDIYYLAHKNLHDNKKTKEIISKICTLFNVVDTKTIDIKNAIISEINDFEDSVLIQTAVRLKVDCIVTRNIKDFKNSPIKVYSPTEFNKIMSNV